MTTYCIHDHSSCHPELNIGPKEPRISIASTLPLDAVTRYNIATLIPIAKHEMWWGGVNHLEKHPTKQMIALFSHTMDILDTKWSLLRTNLKGVYWQVTYCSSPSLYSRTLINTNIDEDSRDGMRWCDL